MRFADDIILITSKIEELNEILNDLNVWGGERAGLTVNAKAGVESVPIHIRRLKYINLSV